MSSTPDTGTLSNIPMKKERVCPRCHQPVRHPRLGIWLPPLKAEIVDAIATAGDIGITSQEIVGTLYRDRRQVSRRTIKALVGQINDQLVATSFKIASEGGDGFSHRA